MSGALRTMLTLALLLAAPLALAAILGRNCLCSKDFAGNARCT